jgi:hypothetical protein
MSFVCGSRLLQDYDARAKRSIWKLWSPTVVTGELSDYSRILKAFSGEILSTLLQQHVMHGTGTGKKWRQIHSLPETGAAPSLNRLNESEQRVFNLS